MTSLYESSLSLVSQLRHFLLQIQSKDVVKRESRNYDEVEQKIDAFNETFQV
jgi:hypothetical protein